MKNKVLIVDDSLSVRVMLREILEMNGYDVLEASNGEEGMRTFKQHPIDLVITDIVMPDKEGLDVVRELKQISTHVKIIAISGGGLVSPENYLRLAKAFGAHETFIKPFHPDAILKSVQQLLEA